MLLSEPVRVSLAQSAGVRDLGRFAHHHLGLLDRGDIDQTAIERHSTLAILLGLFHSLEDPLGLGHFLLGRAVDLVGEIDLAGMNGPFALTTQRRGAVGLSAIAVSIPEVAERAVDRAQAGSA